jgi:hypothetical protein
MKVTIELLRWENSEHPTVLSAISHDSHSIETVAAAAQNVIDSPDFDHVDGYRLVTEGGTEFYGWPDRT